MKLTAHFVLLTQSTKRRLRDEKGQSVILVATVIISFILFFGFAINTGLLVVAKISLQSAADAAAYAGAATQARQLNAISFLNYDMRRQFKKLAFRYAVVGSLGNPQFPTTSPGATNKSYYDFWKYDYSTGIPPSKASIGVPSVCIPLTPNGKSKNDNCISVSLPNANANLPKLGSFSGIYGQLIKDFNAVQDTQQQLCKGNGSINLLVALAWLFQTSATNSDIQNIFGAVTAVNGSPINASDLAQTFETVKSLTAQLGVLPRNVLHLLRIETLVQFLNQPPAVIQAGQTATWLNTQQADQYERGIQAYRSALANLNETVMDPKTVELDELQAPIQIQVQPVTASFNLFIHYVTPAKQPTANAICGADILPFPVPGVPVGVKRTNPNSVVHYAVKLKANAKLMFLPISGGLDLEAFAAAKPFGSRIGPANLSASDFIEPLTPGVVNGLPVTCPEGDSCPVPNPKIGNGLTFFSTAFLNDISSVALSGGTFSGQTLLDSQYSAMAPSVYEVGHYNIIPPPRSTDAMVSEFLTYSDDNNKSVYRFYAPLFPAGGGDTVQRLGAYIDQVFGGVQIKGTNPFGVDMNGIQDQLKSSLAVYINGPLTLGGPDAELSESLTFAAIELPFANIKSTSSNPPNWLTSSSQVLTSWAPNGLRPRFGYSVKFVTMQNLLKNGMPASDDDLTKVLH